MAKVNKSKVSKTKVTKAKVSKSAKGAKSKASPAKALKKIKLAPKQSKPNKTKSSVDSKSSRPSKPKSGSGADKATQAKAELFKGRTQTKLQSSVLTPIEDRIIVMVSSAEKVTAGGIIIPETAQVSGNLRGVVVAVGKGKRNKKGAVRPLDVKKGDEVLFSEFVGTKTDLDGQEVCILRESEILGCVE
jgi:chaperonin GroES